MYILGHFYQQENVFKNFRYISALPQCRQVHDEALHEPRDDVRGAEDGHQVGLGGHAEPAGFGHKGYFRHLQYEDCHKHSVGGEDEQNIRIL